MKTRIFVLALCALALVSCAGFTHVTAPQSTINIIGKDVQTERYVEYKLTKTYILGIGGMSAKARNTNSRLVPSPRFRRHLPPLLQSLP